MTEHLIESFEDGVATLTMNRPEARNALSGEMMDWRCRRRCRRLRRRPDGACVVLTGAGGAFCAGGDVKGFAADTSRGAGVGQGPAPASSSASPTCAPAWRWSWLHEMPKPTLAVIPGPAAGAGLSLALACDLRIAADDAKFTTAFSKVGLPATTAAPSSSATWSARPRRASSTSPPT